MRLFTSWYKITAKTSHCLVWTKYFDKIITVKFNSFCWLFWNCISTFMILIHFFYLYYIYFVCDPFLHYSLFSLFTFISHLKLETLNSIFSCIFVSFSHLFICCFFFVINLTYNSSKKNIRLCHCKWYNYVKLICSLRHGTDHIIYINTEEELKLNSPRSFAINHFSNIIQSWYM